MKSRSYIPKPLEKATMIRLYPEKVYCKINKRKALNHIANRKTFAADTIKKERKRFFNNFNPSFFTESKLFWKTIEPFFSHKGNCIL